MIVTISVCKEVTAQRRKLIQFLFRVHRIEILLQRSKFRLHIQTRLVVHIVEQFLIVRSLSLPFGALAVSEIIAQRNEHRSRFVQRRLFTPLIDDELSSKCEKKKMYFHQ